MTPCSLVEVGIFYKILLPSSRTQHRYVSTRLHGVTPRKTTMLLQSCSDILRLSLILRHDSVHCKQLSPVLNSRGYELPRPVFLLLCLLLVGTSVFVYGVIGRRRCVVEAELSYLSLADSGYPYLVVFHS